MKRKNKRKPYWKMNRKELTEATKEFEEEFVIEKCTSRSPKMRARWEKAKRVSRTCGNLEE